MPGAGAAACVRRATCGARATRAGSRADAAPGSAGAVGAGARMTSGQIGAAVAGVVLVCWIVGAYNRLVSLRNVLVERFAAIDALCRSRHALIERQVALLATALAGARPRLDALDAAARQADAARARAQAR